MILRGSIQRALIFALEECGHLIRKFHDRLCAIWLVYGSISLRDSMTGNDDELDIQNHKMDQDGDLDHGKTQSAYWHYIFISV